MGSDPGSVDEGKLAQGSGPGSETLSYSKQLVCVGRGRGAKSILSQGVVLKFSKFLKEALLSV